MRITKLAFALSPAIFFLFKNRVSCEFQQFQDYDPKYYLVEDSEYLDLEVKTSKIPNSGKGLFAKKSFEPGEIIGEYRGRVLDSKYIYDPQFNEEQKLIYINKKYSLIGQSIVAMANDCVKLPDKLTREKYLKMKEEDEVPTESICKHNAILQDMGNKMFLMAAAKIEPGEEIYVRYGFEYWDYYLQKRIVGDDNRNSS